MYDLKRVSNTEWSLLIEKKTVFTGPLRLVCELAVDLGFNMTDIEEAVNEMSWMEHDSAQFGVMKRFIFTYDTKEKAV